MRNMIFTMCLVGALLAPLPPGIATNPETKECGEISGGDEYGGYELPPPWEISYGVDLSAYSNAETYEERISEYCMQIGYSFVPGNLGMVYGHESKSIVFYFGIIITVLPILIIFALLMFGMSRVLNAINRRSEPQ